jgi:hypothetical protein
MAPRNKKSTVNVALLNAIAAATELDGEGNKIGRITQEEHATIKDFVVVNPSNVVDGKAAVMLNDAGKQYLANLTNPQAASKPMYGIIANAVIPASKRGNRKGAGAPTQYPFDTLEVGQAFFVGNSKKAEAAKKLGSTVSQQNMKYRTPTGQTEVKEVTDRKTKVKASKTVPIYTQDRKFVLRSIKQGDVIDANGNKAPEDGALIGRVDPNAEEHKEAA